MNPAAGKPEIPDRSGETVTAEIMWVSPEYAGQLVQRIASLEQQLGQVDAIIDEYKLARTLTDDPLQNLRMALLAITEYRDKLEQDNATEFQDNIRKDLGF